MTTEERTEQLRQIGLQILDIVLSAKLSTLDAVGVLETAKLSIWFDLLYDKDSQCSTTASPSQS